MKKVISAIFLGLMLLVAVPGVASAVPLGGACTVSTNCDQGLSCQGLKCVDTFGMTQVNTGIGGTLGNTDLRIVIGKVINVALSLLGVVAVVIVLMGGFKWMTAGGNDTKVEEARKIIFQGVIGLAVVLSAWAIAIFVLNSLSSATGSGTMATF